MVASTDGSDRIPKEMVSAIMTVQGQLCAFRVGFRTMPIRLTHASLPVIVDKLSCVAAAQL